MPMILHLLTNIKADFGHDPMPVHHHNIILLNISLCYPLTSLTLKLSPKSLLTF
jgi:hypothetical protein